MTLVFLMVKLTKGIYAQHLEQIVREKVIPVKDWKHLKQAIFGILYGCSDELDNTSFNNFVWIV